MAGLQRCAVPYGKTRGQARRNGFLGRADEGLCAVVAVLLQLTQQTSPSRLPGGRGALQQHEAVRHTGVQDVQCVAHGSVNRVDALWWRGQVAFREYQAQGGRLMPDQRVYPLPILPARTCTGRTRRTPTPSNPHPGAAAGTSPAQRRCPQTGHCSWHFILSGENSSPPIVGPFAAGVKYFYCS